MSYEPFTRRQILLLLALTLVAGILRLWNLGTWSFWIDEAHTFRDVVSTTESFWSAGTSDYPLSFLLLRYLTALFGLGPADLTEAVMRLPFAFFGIASIPILAFTARGMVGRRSALLAAMFLTFSPWHIYWSQNARSYSMVLFFCLTAMGATYYGVQSRSWVRLVLAVLLFFAAGFSHPSAYIIVASVLGYLLLTTLIRGDTDTVIGKWGPVVIVALLVIIVILIQPVLQRMAEVKRPEFSLFHLIQTLVFYVGMPVLVAAVGGALFLFEPNPRSAVFLACMAILPVLALSTLSTIGISKVSAQYAFGTLPALYILAASLVVSLVQVFPGRQLRYLTLRAVPLAILLLHMLGQDYLYFQKQYGWRPRWEEAVRYVQFHSRLQQQTEVCILTTNGPSVRYYLDPVRFGSPSLRDGTIHIETIEKWHLGDNPEAYLDRVILAAKTRGQDIWAILTEPVLDEKDKDGRADVYFREQFHQVRRLPNWSGPRDMVVLIYHMN